MEPHATDLTLDLDPVAQSRRIADRSFVNSLRSPAPWKAAVLTVGLWTQLLAAWVAALLGPWWMVVPAGVVIVICQQAMILWVHEASHHMLHSSKRLNDLWADLLFATPIGVNVKTYRANHLTHHSHLGEAADLDRWTFAFDVRGSKLLREMLLLAVGWYGLKVAWAKYGRALVAGREDVGDAPDPIRLAMAAAWNVALLGVCWLAGRWWLYPLLWLYPILSLTVLLNVVRSIAEHQPAPWTGDVDALAHPPVARTTVPTLWEKWVLYQANFNYHLEHHAFPYVPCSNLRRLHQHLVERGFYRDNPQFLQRSALAALART